VLLHGFGDGGYVWEDTCAALTDICSTVVIDLRGHGDSEHSPSGRYGLDSNLQDLHSIIAQLCFGPIVLIGHSFGGELAASIAADSPAAVVGAVLVDISPGVNQEASRQATTQLRELVRKYRSIEEYCSLLTSMRPLLRDETARQLARGALRQHDDEFHLKLDPALLQYADDEFTTLAQWQALLPMIRCPTLFVRGAGSALVSSSAAAATVRMLSQGQLVTIPCAGHAVMSDNSSAFCAAIADFVSSVLRSRSAFAPVIGLHG
jgi:pimeloyl-ACP methyl ester carboxylesterase